MNHLSSDLTDPDETEPDLKPANTRNRESSMFQYNTVFTNNVGKKPGSTNSSSHIPNDSDESDEIARKKVACRRHHVNQGAESDAEDEEDGDDEDDNDDRRDSEKQGRQEREKGQKKVAGSDEDEEEVEVESEAETPKRGCRRPKKMAKAGALSFIAVLLR